MLNLIGDQVASLEKTKLAFLGKGHDGGGGYAAGSKELQILILGTQPATANKSAQVLAGTGITLYIVTGVTSIHTHHPADGALSYQGGFQAEDPIDGMQLQYLHTVFVFRVQSVFDRHANLFFLCIDCG